MSFMLLWIEMLAACVLFEATLITVGLRRKSRLAVLAIYAVGMLLLAAPLVMMVASAIITFFSPLRSHVFWWTLLLLICYLIGTGVVWRLARRPDETGIRRADSWSVARMATMLAVVISLIYMTMWNMGLKVQVEIQALRAEAGAMALSVMPPQVADSVNAARPYEQADELYKAATVPADENVEYRTLDTQSPEVKGYLERQRKALDLVRRGADMPECRPDYDYLQTDMANILTVQSPARSRANLLATAVKAEAAGGNVDLALADCRRMYALGGHANTPAILINGLIAIAIDNLASKSVAEVLPLVSAKAQVEAFAAPDPRAPMRVMARALRGEEAYGLAMFCDIGSGYYPPQYANSNGSMGTSPLRRSGGAAVWIWWVQDDVMIYRNYFQRLQQMMPQAYYQTAAERNEVAAELQPGKRRGVMSAMLMPSLLRELELTAETQTFREEVALALAATGYRLDHGTYPATAEALVPAYMDTIPLDPFDGQPLRFKKNDDGSITIYSVGPDGKDDGGQIERTKTKPLDTGFILRLPAKQG
jgi:hypothetical protein